MKKRTYIRISKVSSNKKGKNSRKAYTINCLKHHVHHSHFLLVIIVCWLSFVFALFSFILLSFITFTYPGFLSLSRCFSFFFFIVVGFFLDGFLFSILTTTVQFGQGCSRCVYFRICLDAAEFFSRFS